MKKSVPKPKGIHIYTSLEKIAVMAMLEKNGGNVLQTAKASKISRTTLLRWIDEAKIEKPVLINVEKKQKTKAPEAVMNPATLADPLIDNITDPLEMTKLVHISTLKRLYELVQKETNMDNLTKLAQTTSKIIEIKPGTDQQPTNEIQLNLAIQNVENNYQMSPNLYNKLKEEVRNQNIE